ncbi:putative exostosin [Rosa chinensis]|uniref:Putative exostosin n=1 Tax=Rosa chinensis TaxID=74649 RepID=A0A2P6QW37_ROSCH|nr:probable xyloglucan galactosyltransferase GT14 [Rosa chinensis]PRQ38390.1 putative exostosin [Rosa chinensis]
MFKSFWFERAAHPDQMEKLLTGKCSREVLFGILVSFCLCFALLCLHNSTSLGFSNWVNILGNSHVHHIFDSCSGRYIYVYDDLPSKFNYDLLRNCKSLTSGSTSDSGDEKNMCPYLVNMGLGPEIESSKGVLANKSWFTTNPYLLEVIFHNRMKQYECLTNISTLASAIYVPYYTGLDASLHLWDTNLTVRDSSGKDLVKWLSGKPEWKTMWGRDHFMVTGRTSWDFRRTNDNAEWPWGSGLRFLPESKNMSMLSVEGSLWKNDFAIPYPTNFHPAKDIEIIQWQNRMRYLERPYLFSFIGAPRPGLEKSIRGELIDQCRASSTCKFVNCGADGINCNNPITVMKVFQSSVYCLQPPGDSHTRRSAFDSMLAGCIPVFFHPGSAYNQYLWHLPKNHSRYSVFIPAKNVTDLKEVSIEKLLLGISKEKQLAMRKKVIKLIPKLVYADPRSRLGTEDAFDFAVMGILERVENVRQLIREGKDPSIGFADEDSLKYTFPETLE